MKRVAVFAHYDKDAELTNNTLKILEQLKLVCERIIVVSTNLDIGELKKLSPDVECYIRENVGYDFYSYKYGIGKIDDLYIYDELILINDSFFIGTNFDIKKIINDAENNIFDICGLVDSYQFHYHIQTFFVVIKKEALLSVWFNNFWRDVTILNTKLDIIFKYEIGLSQSAISHSLTVGSCFQWKNSSYVHALFNCIRKKNWRLIFLSIFSLKYLREGNSSHMLWKEIFEEYSICKWESVRMYPEVISYIERMGDQKELDEVKEYLNKKAAFYKNKHIDGQLKAISGTTKTTTNYSIETLLNKRNKKNENNSMAVILHLYYTELIDEISAYLLNIPEKFDLFISVVDMSSVTIVEEKLNALENASLYLYLVENKGRDVGPFLSILNSGILDQYYYICKIHSKKSLYSENGAIWRNQIYDELLGSTSKILSIIKAFQNDPLIGIIGPEHSYLTNNEFWGANFNRVRLLTESVGIKKIEISLGFFAGTMFWFNPKVMTLLKKANLSIEDFEDENGAQDGTLAHAVERIIVLFAKENKFKIMTTDYLDSDVDSRNYTAQKIPVL